MKVIVVGAVAAGTKAAAKIKRQDQSAEVVILTKGKDISYAGCGLPYYVSGTIADRSELIVNTPEKFMGLTGTRVLTECEVTGVDTAEKKVHAVRNGETVEETYDKLVIAVGADPVVPRIDGSSLEGVFTVRTPEDAVNIKDYAEKNGCRNAVVVGAGFIGMEMAENLKLAGLNVTVVEMQPNILPGVLDKEMADFAARKLKDSGLRIMTGAPVQAVLGTEKAEAVTAAGVRIPADIVVMALGIRPATAFLNDSGIRMDRGAIVVNEKMETSAPDVYAAGDCVVVRNRLSGKPQRSPMGSTANITGRILAQNMTGANLSYSGCMGTAIVRLMEGLCAGRTGYTEKQAVEEGYSVITTMCVADEKPGYMPGSAVAYIKVIADKNTDQLLGVQVIGVNAVDKITDMAVLAVSMKMKVSDMADMDFAYAPPFSTAIHPLSQACMVLQNKIDGAIDSMTPQEYTAGAAKGYTIVDAQSVRSINGAKWIDYAKLTGPVEGLAKDEKILLVCKRGRMAYMTQNRLRSYGYTNTKVLEGGLLFNQVKVRITGTIPADEIKRVKGLGCLVDKRYGDRFNVRVITRNGKLTADEQRAVAECAEKYGSGEVTMTTRLTLEIQCVPYENLDAVMDYLKEHGLETGGTGSKVRPVVSCKGTTCQYGLCDTFDLSQKLHETFYEGWHDVTLPHKFKLAVGGCPNNCVKPNLNDLGIIGQRVPQPDLSKCRGCKVCQVEKSCPINVAKMVDGKVAIDPEACNHCGRCVTKCPFGALEEGSYGYKVYIGGRWGKRVKEGQALHRIFTSEDEIMALVEKAILLFRDEGITGERFSDTIDRLGFDYVEDKLLNGTIDKEAVLKKTVVGGAKC